MLTGLIVASVIIAVWLLLLMLATAAAPKTQNAYVETYGSALVYGTAGGTPATSLAGIDALRGLPASLADIIEISRIDQASRSKQKAATMIDTGTLQLTLGMNKTDYATLLGFVGVLKSWKFTFSQGSTDQWDGFIQKQQPRSEAPNGEVLVDIDIVVSGSRTFTAN